MGGRHAVSHPWHKTLIYELHVKGFTARHPEVPPALRGTYAGLTCPAVIDYLCTLGITAVELMPVQQFVADKHLVDQGLTNYWGYNSIGLFAPDACYASTDILGQQVAEFKTMVKTLHREGIEVILDVVYNHTGEGNHLGPTLCFRGIDNAAYYRLMADNRRYYMDYTGCGNTLNMTTRARSSSLWTVCGMGVGDARGWLPVRPGLDVGAPNSTRWIGWGRSLISSIRIRCYRR